jgi:ammonium transporter, Amt family
VCSFCRRVNYVHTLYFYYYTLRQLQKVAADQSSLADGLNAFFLIYAGALVFFMQTGFAMLCAGSIRAKNCKNVILWNLLDSAGGGIAYWATGYAFAYGGDDSGKKTFVGNAAFFLKGDEIRLENWFFQWAFACAVSSIVAGTIAERTQMKAYLMYSFFCSGFVYPVVSHAYWSTNGFLSITATDRLWDCGIIDLAGSGPV